MSCVWPMDGFDVKRLTFRRGIVTTEAAPTHILSMHAGEPVSVDCACDDTSYRGVQLRGRIDLTPAGARARWEDTAETPVVVVAVSPALLSRNGRELGIDSDRLNLTPRFQACDPQLEHMIWALASIADAGAQAEPLIADSLARAVIFRLISTYAGVRVPRGPQQGLSPRQKRRVIEYIESALADRINLADIAEVAGVSVSHLKVLFKRSMGQSVHQYLIERRVEHAASLIKDDAASLSEIAAAAGFSHQSHMARCMRRVMGVNPTALIRDDR